MKNKERDKRGGDEELRKATENMRRKRKMRK